MLNHPIVVDQSETLRHLRIVGNVARRHVAQKSPESSILNVFGVFGWVKAADWPLGWHFCLSRVEVPCQGMSHTSNMHSSVWHKQKHTQRYSDYKQYYIITLSYTVYIHGVRNWLNRWIDTLQTKPTTSNRQKSWFTAFVCNDMCFIIQTQCALSFENRF